MSVVFASVGFEVLGLIAALFSTVAFLPQVLQTWRSRSARGLSLPMLVVLTAGVVLWLVYGLGTGQLPVILANAATLMLVGILLAFKLRERAAGQR
jgi:MtN3 and saliva related transmembrane protein